VVFSQSQGQGRERGSDGVAVDPAGGKNNGHFHIRASRDGGEGGKKAVHIPTSVTCVTEKHFFLVKGALTHLSLCIIRGGAGRGGGEGWYGPRKG